MSSEPDARREALLPPRYEGGAVDLVTAAQRLRSAEPDDVEFASVSARYVVATAALGVAVMASLVVVVAGLNSTTLVFDLVLLGLAAAVICGVLLATRVLGRLRPAWRPVLERILWLGAAILRTLCLVVNVSAFVMLVVFGAVKWFDPDVWGEVLAPLEWPTLAVSIAAAVLAMVLTLRRPIVHADPRWTWVHAVSTPLPSIVAASLGLLVVALTPLIPDDLDTVRDTTAVFASLASVAAVIAAVAAAWASIGVGVAQHARSMRRALAASFLAVADAARRVRVERDVEPHAVRRRDELCAALDRLLNDVRHARGAQPFAPVPADDGVVLALEGVSSRLLGLPPGPSALAFARSIDRYVGQPDEHRLVAGLEAFAREFAVRARTNASSTPSEFVAALAVLDADAVARETTRAATLPVTVAPITSNRNRFCARWRRSTPRRGEES